MGSYSDKIKKSHEVAHLTPQQISEKKNQRCKLRNADRAKRKQDEIKQRELDRSKRGDKGQLAALDMRFGVGQGAAKERARLEKQITEKAAEEKAIREKAEREKAAKQEQKARKYSGPRF